jgi:protein-S-isoprenylcysteine O-methyltransferase Ste14
LARTSNALLNFFDYFQVVIIIIVLAIVAGRALSLRVGKNITAIAIGGGKQGLVFAIEIISFIGLVVWIVEILLHAFHSQFKIFPAAWERLLIESTPAKTLGVVLISAGLLIFILAFLSFGDSWRVGFDVRKPGDLVTQGIFAASRNPIYVFFDLWFLAEFLINGSIIFLIFFLLAIIAVHWQILQEEKFLTKLYGAAYSDYRSRTPRYLFW